MKKILAIILFSFACIVGYSQTYNASIDGTTSNAPYAPAQAVPTDSRSMFHDRTNFLYRPYQDTAEVRTYLNLSKYRTGNFLIVVDSGGTLLPNGTYSGIFINTFWMYKDGTADNNLVKLNLTGSGGGGGGSGTVTAVTATNGSGLTFTITNPNTTPNISIVTAGGGDISGPLNNVTVNKFNGLTPSYYLNYNNLTNTPTIPAQFNPIAGSGITLSGFYPNITFSASGTGGGFNTAGYGLIALSSSTVAIDSQNYRKVDTLYSLNDSTVIYKLNGHSDTLVIKGGANGGGGGTGTVTNVSVTTANGVSATVANPTSTPNLTFTLGAITPSTVNGLTLTALATGFTIQGGTTSKTLTVPLDATVSGTNTGNVTLSGENYLSISGQAITVSPVNVSGTNITGILKAASFPALTGQVTTSAGSLTTTIATNTVTNSNLAQMPTLTIKGNNTGGTANAADLTVAQVNAILPVFTTTLNGLVPNPGSATGKVLSDAGTWITNGTGNPNSNIGSFYRWAIPFTNNIKTFAPGFGVLLDSTTNTNAITAKVDTSVIATKGADTVFIQNVPSGGTGLGLAFSNGDTLKFKRLNAGANITLTQNADSSITITSSGGGGGGGITFVGTIDRLQSVNGLTVSADSILANYASPSFPGMIKATGAQTIGATLTFSSAPSISTLTTPGGIFYGNAAGTFQQTGAGTATTVLHGGTSPTYSAVSMANDVTGILAKGNGGTGTASPALVAGTGITITGTWPNNTISASGGSVTSVAMSGGTTGLTFSGGPITSSGTFTAGGILVVANGGSGLGSLSPYALIAGGSTSTGNMQQVSGTGTVGQLLRSNGAGALPSWTSTGAAIDSSAYHTITSINDSSFTLNRLDGTQDTVQIRITATTGATTLNNGLTLTGNNGQLGGILVQNTTINTSTFTLTATGTSTSQTFQGTNSGTGNGIGASAVSGSGVSSTSSSGAGGLFLSTSGTGIQGQSTSGLAGYFIIGPSSTNTVVPVIRAQRGSSGTAANGIGGSIELYNQTTTTSQLSNSIISKWTDATNATRTSEFSITGINSGASTTLLTLGGNGKATLNKYGVGSFTSGTPVYNLQSDASGNIMEGAVTLSSTYTPSLTNTANITTSSNNRATYIRVGNIVYVNISVSVTCTSNAASTQLTISLPITTSQTSQGNIGTIVGGQGSAPPAIGNGAVNSATTALFIFQSVNSGSADGYHIMFQYEL